MLYGNGCTTGKITEKSTLEIGEFYQKYVICLRWGDRIKTAEQKDWNTTSLLKTTKFTTKY